MKRNFNSVTNDLPITSNIVTKGTSNFTHAALNAGDAVPASRRPGIVARVKTGVAFVLAAAFGLFVHAQSVQAQIVVPEEMETEGLINSGLAQWATSIEGILTVVVVFALLGVVIRLLSGRKAVKGS